MRKLAFVPLALLCIGAAPPQAEPAPSSGPQIVPTPDGFVHDMNVMRNRADCVPIPRQVTGEDRRYDGTRLDQQPPGRLILAVDRRVNGCPEVTFANQQRRTVRPIFPERE